MYVDYAKKKLEVARRIHLISGTGSQATLYNVTAGVYWFPKALTDNDPLQAWTGQRIENHQSDSENRTVC